MCWKSQIDAQTVEESEGRGVKWTARIRQPRSQDEGWKANPGAGALSRIERGGLGSGEGGGQATNGHRWVPAELRQSLDSAGEASQR